MIDAGGPFRLAMAKSEAAFVAGMPFLGDLGEG